MIELLLHAERALSVGMLDRAETLYRQVAAADPRNSIAFVGLSRVALDRGDELEALELARQGLALDPENNAAQRMVQRLEEIIDYRLEVEGPIMPARPDLGAALGTAPEAESATAEPDETTEAEPEPGEPEPVEPVEAEPEPGEPEPTTEASGEGEATPAMDVEPEPEAPTEADSAVDPGTAAWAPELDAEPAAVGPEGRQSVATGEPHEMEPRASPEPWPSPSPPPWAPTDPWPSADIERGTAIDPWPQSTPDPVEPARAFPDVAVPTPTPAADEEGGARRSWFDRLFRRER